MPVTREAALKFLQENDAIGIMILDKVDGDPRKWQPKTYAVASYPQPVILGMLQRAVSGLAEWFARGDYMDLERGPSDG